MTDLVQADLDDVVVERRRRVAELVQALAASEIPDNTRRAYAADQADYEAWCTTLDIQPWPASVETLVSYIADPTRQDPRTGKPYQLRVDTIKRHLSAIAHWHAEQGIEPLPTADYRVKKAVKALAHQQAEAGTHGPHRQAAPFTLELLQATCERLDRTRLADIRNRAILCVGFWGALRRAELVALNIHELVEQREGLDVRVRKSKTDQEGTHHPVPIPYLDDEAACAVRAWQAWRSAAGLIAGPAFRSINQHDQIRGRLPANRVNAIVKDAAARLGEDPTRYSAHSLRAGFITTAAKQGIPEWMIMRHTRHETLRILQGYIRVATRWEQNAAAMIRIG